MTEHGDEHRRDAVEGRDLLAVDAVETDVRGEKYGSGQSVPPCVIIDVMDSTMPKQWNIGTWIIIRSAVERSMRSPMVLPLFMMLRWVSITPFGKPVVPEVYCMLQTSSGLTEAAIMRTLSSGTLSALSRNSFHVRHPSSEKPTVTMFLRNGSLPE